MAAESAEHVPAGAGLTPLYIVRTTLVEQCNVLLCATQGTNHELYLRKGKERKGKERNPLFLLFLLMILVSPLLYATPSVADTPPEWQKPLCAQMAHAIIASVTSTETISKEGYPYQRAVLEVIWTSNPSAYTYGTIEIEQFGGCLGSNCNANNAVFHVKAGEIWLLFVAGTPVASTPLALGKLGMFRIETSAEQPTSVTSGTKVFTTSRRALLLTENGVVLVTPDALPEQGSSALAIAESIVAACEEEEN